MCAVFRTYDLQAMRPRKAVALLFLVAASLEVRAATRTWSGPSGNWSDGTKWVGGVAPSSGDDLVFPGIGTPETATNDFPGGTPFRSITLGPNMTPTGSRPPNLAGNSIVLGSGGIDTTTCLCLRSAIGLPLTLGVSQTWTFRGFTSRDFTSTLHLNGQALALAQSNPPDTSNPPAVFLQGDVAGTGSITASHVSVILTGVSKTTTAPLTVGDAGITVSTGYPGSITHSSAPSSTAFRIEGLTSDVIFGSISLNGPILGAPNTHRGAHVHSGDFAMTGGVFVERIWQATSVDTETLVVSGTVTLAQPQLELDVQLPTGAGDLPPGSTYTIIDNDGTDAVSGTFAGLPEGAPVTSPGTDSGDVQWFTISYAGGTGNDVVLTAGRRPMGTSLVVSNLNDSGAGSLRQAVLDANAFPGMNTITFVSGLSGTLTLTGGGLAITDSVQIRGPGSGAVTISGNNQSRIFAINAPDVSIEGLTLTAGLAAQGGALDMEGKRLTLVDVHVTNSVATTGDGGGIRFATSGFQVDSALLMSRCSITGNRAPNGSGGGVRATAQHELYFDSTIASNRAGRNGGGLDVTIFFGLTSEARGILGIHRCVVNANQGGMLGNGNGNGGGIAVHGDAHVETGGGGPSIDGTRIVGNSTTGDGGGLWMTAATTESCRTGIFHSEITDNSAARGGGVFDTQTSPFAQLAKLTVWDSTVANNTATTEGGGLWVPRHSEIAGATIAGNTAGVRGGGIVYTRDGTHRIVSSIIADNVAPANADAETRPGVSAAVDHSLIESPGTATLTFGAGSLSGQDPQLGPLQFDEGSPTRTRDPLPGSAVIDAGIAASSSLDQRYRPRTSGAATDMGAVETQSTLSAVDLAITKVADTPTTSVGAHIRFTITVTNNSATPAGSVRITDVLPTGTNVVNVDPRCSVNSRVIVCGLETLTGTYQFSYTVLFDRPGTFVNEATVSSVRTDPIPSNNTATASVTISEPLPPAADLTLSQTVSATQAEVGEDVVFTLTIRNAGPGAATLLQVNAPIPPNAQFVSVTSTNGTCALSGNRVGCEIGTLSSGATATIRITVRPSANGPLALTATVSAGGAGEPDPNLVNNSATAAITIGGDHVTDIPLMDPRALLVLTLVFAALGALLLRRT